MISFAITLSTDKAALGEFETGKNTLTVGSREADLLIQDDKMAGCHFTLKVGTQDTCIVEVVKGEYIAVNGRKAHEEVVVRKNDTIQAGKTSFHIKSFTFTNKNESFQPRKLKEAEVEFQNKVTKLVDDLLDTNLSK